MLSLAALAAPEVIRQMPPLTWAKAGIALGVLLVAALVLRKIARMNKLLLGIVLLVACSLVFFSWVYNRHEPEFLTPVVEKIAPYFPKPAPPPPPQPVPRSRS